MKNSPRSKTPTKKGTRSSPTITRRRVPRFVTITHFKNHTRITFTFRTSRKKSSRSKKSIQLQRKLSTIFYLCMLGSSVAALAIVFSPYVRAYLLADTYSPPKAIIASEAKQKAKKQLALSRSTPSHIQVASIGLDAALVTTDKDGDGSIKVPEAADAAGWYQRGPSPGEIGPAIIVGHLDTAAGKAVFSQLSTVKIGDAIKITRADSKQVTFIVTNKADFPQTSFPTQAVYGNIGYPGLRLITCGGSYDFLAHHYTTNTVVYASLKS